MEQKDKLKNLRNDILISTKQRELLSKIKKENNGFNTEEIEASMGENKRKIKENLAQYFKKKNTCTHIYCLKFNDPYIDRWIENEENCYGCLECGSIFLSKDHPSFITCTHNEFEDFRNSYKTIADKYKQFKNSENMINHVPAKVFQKRKDYK